jgi:hypothetical protein
MGTTLSKLKYLVTDEILARKSWFSKEEASKELETTLWTQSVLTGC